MEGTPFVYSEQVVVFWCGGSPSPSLPRLLTHLLLSSLLHLLLLFLPSSLNHILIAAAVRHTTKQSNKMWTIADSGMQLMLVLLITYSAPTNHPDENLFIPKDLVLHKKKRRI